MTGFSPEWLALREPVDVRSRNSGLLMDFAARIKDLTELSFVDLGCGTGSNLRATALAFRPEQRQCWQLCDHDAALLAQAKRVLTAWADTHRDIDGALHLVKEARNIEVSFRQVDLTGDLENLFKAGDIVTAAAFFDLVSEHWIERFAAAVAKVRAPVFTVLTYNGIEMWSPPHVADPAMLVAFHAHQRTDKGFGRASGPGSVADLSKALMAHDYTVETRGSDWVLGDADRTLIQELATGSANAVAELSLFDADVIEEWKQNRRSAASCVIGHADLVAWPSK